MDNLTPRAQQTLALARKAADRMNHEDADVEHLLLGLIMLGQGVAINALIKKEGFDLESVRQKISDQIGLGPEKERIGSIHYTDRVKRILATASEEAESFNHSYVGTEHLLLGILSEDGGVACEILREAWGTLDEARDEVLRELNPNAYSDEREEIDHKKAIENVIRSLLSNAQTLCDLNNIDFNSMVFPRIIK